MAPEKRRTPVVTGPSAGRDTLPLWAPRTPPESGAVRSAAQLPRGQVSAEPTALSKAEQTPAVSTVGACSDLESENICAGDDVGV